MCVFTFEYTCDFPNPWVVAVTPEILQIRDRSTLLSLSRSSSSYWVSLLDFSSLCLAFLSSISSS